VKNPRATIRHMPKRKAADVNVEPVTAPEPKKRSSAMKPNTVAAATHKRTPRKAKAETSTAAVSPVETVVDVPLAVSSPEPVAKAMPAREEISLRAWLYAEARGFQGGSPEQDWLRAERELMELAKNR
jgi:hypothetical protein